jgi:hypothetical protein
VPNYLRVKPGVQFDPIAPAGFRILSALEQTARRLQLDLTITCGSEDHPPTDPQTLGAAYDVRTHGFTWDQKQAILREVLLELSDDPTNDAPMLVGGGLGVNHFWGWVEAPGAAHEHFHIQRRRGTVYDPVVRA